MFSESSCEINLTDSRRQDLPLPLLSKRMTLLLALTEFTKSLIHLSI